MNDNALTTIPLLAAISQKHSFWTQRTRLSSAVLFGMSALGAAFVILSVMKITRDPAAPCYIMSATISACLAGSLLGPRIKEGQRGRKNALLSVRDGMLVVLLSHVFFGIILPLSLALTIGGIYAEGIPGLIMTVVVFGFLYSCIITLPAGTLGGYILYRLRTTPPTKVLGCGSHLAMTEQQPVPIPLLPETQVKRTFWTERKRLSAAALSLGGTTFGACVYFVLLIGGRTVDILPLAIMILCIAVSSAASGACLGRRFSPARRSIKSACEAVVDGVLVMLLAHFLFAAVYSPWTPMPISTAVPVVFFGLLLSTGPYTLIGGAIGGFVLYRLRTCPNRSAHGLGCGTHLRTVSIEAKGQ